MYRKGWGVDKDLLHSYAWFYTAAKSNNSTAVQALDKVRASLMSEQLNEAESIAKDYLIDYGAKSAE